MTAAQAVVLVLVSLCAACAWAPVIVRVWRGPP